MSKDERDIFEKYIRPQLGLIRRIKFKIWALTRSKKIRTIRDLEYLDYSLLIKILCVIMLVSLARTLGEAVYDIYIWLFPRTVIEGPGYLTPMVNEIMECVRNVKTA